MVKKSAAIMIVYLFDILCDLNVLNTTHETMKL